MTDIAVARPALWRRILAFPLTRLALIGPVVFLLLGVTNGFRTDYGKTPAAETAVVVGMVAATYAVYVLFVRFVERRPVDELSLAGAGRELAIGLAIGAGLYTGCVLILMVLGIYRIDGMNSWTFMLPAIPMAVSAGFLEELLFRGVLFRLVEAWLGSGVSVVVSSALFGLVHLVNPAATMTGAIFIAVEAGLLLAAAFMVTRRLWLAIGFHVAWNWTQEGVFSGIVSGSAPAPGLLKSTISGPVALTGGNFGLEASLIAFLLCTTTGVVLLILAKRRGHVMPGFWAR